MTLGVLLSNVSRLELLGSQGRFLLDGGCVGLREMEHALARLRRQDQLSFIFEESGETQRKGLELGRNPP